MAALEPERQARKQVPWPIVDEAPADKANYNIWHHKPNDRRKAEPKKAAAHRCRPARDSGRTRGSESGASFCCIDFARGVCAVGPGCNYLHRVPTAAVRRPLPCSPKARAATRGLVVQGSPARRLSTPPMTRTGRGARGHRPVSGRIWAGQGGGGARQPPGRGVLRARLPHAVCQLQRRRESHADRPAGTPRLQGR